MMQETKVNRDAVTATQTQPQLAHEVMPTANRSNIFSRAAAVFAMTATLATNEVAAQAPAASPTSPTPIVEPAIPRRSQSRPNQRW